MSVPIDARTSSPVILQSQSILEQRGIEFDHSITANISHGVDRIFSQFCNMTPKELAFQARVGDEIQNMIMNYGGSNNLIAHSIGMEALDHFGTMLYTHGMQGSQTVVENPEYAVKLQEGVNKSLTLALKAVEITLTFQETRDPKILTDYFDTMIEQLTESLQELEPNANKLRNYLKADKERYEKLRSRVEL
ncbi:hypothetical protein A3A93_01090 [Candidatus Roizmanbacteria bacterium RIFCSPLOWO2_01_FULL_38_12]|uniref:Uncharacterized protein n=1 Tax=Candidatus Roizmanbacteria bacterium RIFCSPLOWO2_01_FULL_38_12 TaxID=1802061 RepID=A0A1F7IRA3_9BACT|nr:MAG: hypothetical protein A2861_00365 [Candidatus Roizmanbacteria bacterium RIFCSPHIGHO2_01_FULL_38_15]OGK35411.1 MAG: hypothetical protein A3F59_00695 [Candidatus Roizmanbacteria bacterium RIFCSPHIGHO2_12_FULL_38_13]OGK45887.1 MAG: hypothetical protein A3A93_01090 [Candidatus Roizmanbacteria bacterium RIFCSPLOWO2_01_FULL_38_12]